MTLAHFSAPIDDRYFEDYVPGAIYEFGPALMSEADIIAFARLYDPQGIHTDAQIAATGPYEGLIASGWHTIGVLMRLCVDHYLSANASHASPGVDEVRWTKPVRPGDQLTVRLTTIDKRVSRTKPDRGIVRTMIEGVNQHGEIVVGYRAMNIFSLRHPAKA